MEKTFRTPIGRPDTVCLDHMEGPDKWAILDQLTIAAETYELSHRTLTVLKALLTFLPTRHIPQGAAAIVFASNTRLSERLHGMPESTLRRHLSQLVRLGIVSRHDSPNRKRFARNRGGAITAAFGFDLSPLTIHAKAISIAAADARALQEHLRGLRDDVLMLRAQLIRQGNQDELVSNVSRMLRRKPEEEQLIAMTILLKKALITCDENADLALKMSAAYNQIERHIQDSDKTHFDSEGQGAHLNYSKQPVDNSPTIAAEKDQGVTLAEVVDTCKEFQSFFPTALRDWPDLIRIADQIAQMLGIEQPVMIEAKRTMGGESAAVTVLCILEKAQSIRSPGAYLRRLTQMAKNGAFSLNPMVAALKNRVIVS